MQKYFTFLEEFLYKILVMVKTIVKIETITIMLVNTKAQYIVFVI